MSIAALWQCLTVIKPWTRFVMVSHVWCQKLTPQHHAPHALIGFNHPRPPLRIGFGIYFGCPVCMPVVRGPFLFKSTISSSSSAQGGGKWKLFAGPEHDSSSNHTLLSQDKLRFPVSISVLYIFLATSRLFTRKKLTDRFGLVVISPKWQIALGWLWFL